ncbi:MspA family porin [Nocardia beijingensis]|uniref:MspA family porin n=1 Tax=Nocardia beijingensis TaxID=95162 RepID=UPI00340CA14A
MMNRKHSRTLSALIAVAMAVTGAFAVSDSVAGAAPGEINAGGLHLVASANASNVMPGGDIAQGVPFVHAVKVSGDFSVTLDGATALRGGEIAIGYLVGCAVDIANGISIGISPNVGVDFGIAPSFGLEGSLTWDAPSVQMNMPDKQMMMMPDKQMMMMPSLQLVAPPSVTVGAAVGIQPSFDVEAGVAVELAVNLAPGSVTAAVIGAAEIDGESEFPYTFAHTNTPLNISGCLSPASAMPFVTVRADSKRATAQTTGYGAPFWF